MRKLFVLVVSVGGLAFAPAAQAAIPSVFTGKTVGGGSISCGDREGVRFCEGSSPSTSNPAAPDTRVPTFDGVPIDVNVALPPAPTSGTDGNYPLLMMFHGYGGSKLGFGSMKAFAERGYAVFSMSDRGFGNSCGNPGSRLTPACATGWVKLLDTRFEVRDAQLLAGMLADEGVVDPQRIGATGGSYGGGLSMALASLRDRVMMPDGSLSAWTSPGGKPMQIAAAAPEIPWTDLAYALAPNGRTLDYVADAPYRGPNGDAPTGVLKQSYVAGLYAAGNATGYYAPPGVDGDADLTTWFVRVNAGEPYDGDPLVADLIDELTTHHSSYYIDHSRPPAPLLISNGWTDDLFPPHEAIRFYNRTRAEFPGNDISLFFLDYGHPRGQNRSSEVAQLDAAQDAWFDHYLKGSGERPQQGVTAISQTCGDEDYAKPFAGPFRAPTWDELSPGEVRLVEEASKTIAPAGGSPQDGQTFDPIVAEDNPCDRTDGSDKPGTASYRLDVSKVRRGGFTLMGSPTVIADISSPGPHSQVAARLLDVAPDGQQTLIARALYRPNRSGRQVFQLHPNGWKFQPGHVAKLELLPNDSPFGRPTNGQAPVNVANLDLRLPTLERIGRPLPAFLPEGYRPAPGIDAAGRCETGLTKSGTRKRDRIKGTAGGDHLRGRKGSDRIVAVDGEDCAAGNKGKDRLNGGEGRDKLRGGKGNDKIKAADGERDQVSCGSGKKDKVVADSKDKLRGCERKRRR